ncbi:MAG: orotate phosphoribosyltransferase [Candidatus Marinimicrobia bacterium]|nr:orotate phosphoribosyltransferase [Candidatus Neomarinimicrobiota bacterium]
MLSPAKCQFIECLIQEGVLKFGSFTLKSGMESPFFLNLGNIASAKALDLTGKAFAEMISECFPEASHIYGPPYKGISLATATVMKHPDRRLAMFYNRKEMKTHGEKGMFVGHTPEKESTVIMVDDVMTTGGTKLEAMVLIERTFGVKVAGVVVAADRRRKGEITEFPVPLKSLIDLPDLIEYMKTRNPSMADVLNTFYHGESNG